MAKLILQNVSKNYTNGETVHALRNVSFSIDQGETVSVCGPSGSGKTTLLSLIGALDIPTAGKIVVNGIEINAMSPMQMTEYRRTEVGFVFQMHNLIPYLTALENVELPMIAAGVDKKTRIKRAKQLLGDVNLYHRRNHLPSQLSGGERQRVAFARAIANNPLIILADEPTGQLDSQTGLKVVDLMKSITRNRNGILIIATHDNEVWNQLDRIITLRNGEVISDSRDSQC